MNMLATVHPKIKYKSSLHLVLLLCSLLSACGLDFKLSEYEQYHQKILLAESMIPMELYEEALEVYEDVHLEYEHVFLRDSKIAAQLALYIGQKEKSLEFIHKGLKKGWILDSLRNNPLFLERLSEKDWAFLEGVYPKLHLEYESALDTGFRAEVKKLFDNDQQLAMQAAMIEDEEAQMAFIESEFPPHSNQQLIALTSLIKNKGYPGERLIGNDYWVSTILSHHNSISAEFTRQDSLYPALQPLLKRAFDRGEVSPYERVLVEDWKLTVLYEGNHIGYGFLTPPSRTTLEEIDQMRMSLYLRPVVLRNQLIQVQRKTGINFYLPDWVEGEIEITD